MKPILGQSGLGKRPQLILILYNRENVSMNSNFRNFALWGLIALLLIALFQMFQSPSSRQKTDEVAYSKFLEAVNKNRVKSVTISGDRISGEYTDSATGFLTYAPYDPELVKRLQTQNVEITAKPVTDGRSTFTGMLINWLPLLLLVGVWIFIMRQMQSGQGKAMGFGKSKAKLLTEAHGKVTFTDVAELMRPRKIWLKS